MSSKKLILWRGAATDPSGYGEATRGYLAGLAQYDDLYVKLKPETFWRGDPCRDQHWDVLTKLHRNDFNVETPHIFVQHLTPENYVISPANAKCHIGITTFETDRIPQGWKMQMRGMDEIWTFSQWGADIFNCNGIDRVKVMRHGVDTVTFRPGLPKLKEIRGNSSDRFVFGANFDWTERKNPGALLRAYLSAFRADEPVVLALKTYWQHGGGSNPLEQSRSYIRAYIENLRAELGLTRIPPIVLISDMMPSESIPNFYASLDAYVLPARGEGWGLTYSEAMACGLPTIGTGWGGNTEFMNEENSYLLKYKLTDVPAGKREIPAHYVGHQWASVDLDHLRHTMRQVFERREEAAERGSQARKDMVRWFSWKTACEHMKLRLDDIAQERL
jgi:glycosyltransferase involved in cell wall biosynthesis